MARTNVSTKTADPVLTHEGARASRVNPAEQLRRTVLSCMLFEKGFYEDGVEISARIADLVKLVSTKDLNTIAIEAREKMNLRHAPLFMCREMARYGKLESWLLTRIIQRADELAEFLAMYWADGRCPISHAVREGLADAFHKFSEYNFAKYDRDSVVKLSDVIRMVHPKPKDSDESELFRKIRHRELTTPETWEVELSKPGADKKAVWTKLLTGGQLGGMALIRNLRNFGKAGVDRGLVKSSLGNMRTARILPFRFIAASKHAPDYEPELEQAMFKSVADIPKLKGRTCILVDVSGSMNEKLSAKSDMTRMDAACAIAMIAREMCEDACIYTFSNQCIKVPPRRGFALRDAIVASQPHMGSFMGSSIRAISGPLGASIRVEGTFGWMHQRHTIDFECYNESYDRIICITDEQLHDTVPSPYARLAYINNVSHSQYGVGYGQYLHVNGWSPAILNYIGMYESEFKESKLS